jgi:ferredoxin
MDSSGLDRLLARLGERGYRVIGPQLRDHAIVYDDLASAADLPAGWTDEQEAGHYRVRRRTDQALFGYNLGPDSWKRFLHPPRATLWQGSGAGAELRFVPVADPVQPLAFIGVRACELRAIAIQDRVLLGGAYADPHYRARREQALFIAVNCSQSAPTCFCVSMDSGPEVRDGYDLVLTELSSPGGQRFLVRAGSETGALLLAGLPLDPVTPSELEQASVQAAAVAGSMGREMPAATVPALLKDNPEHPRWDDVAQRCLACANCTMVCPTCFCTTVEDHTTLTGEASRSRRWDSCFSLDFSALHGGSVRSSVRSRYRQWITHKLSSWHEQFESSGCVGCGRCISWCPVGIDITEEVRAIAASPVVTGERE